jgi:hypothetical protein
VAGELIRRDREEWGASNSGKNQQEMKDEAFDILCQFRYNIAESGVRGDLRRKLILVKRVCVAIP